MRLGDGWELWGNGWEVMGGMGGGNTSDGAFKKLNKNPLGRA